MTELAITGLAARLGAYADVEAFIADVIAGVANMPAPVNGWDAHDVQSVITDALSQAEIDIKLADLLLGVDRTYSKAEHVSNWLPKRPIQIVTGTNPLFATLKHAAMTLLRHADSYLLLVIATPEGTMACVITRRDHADEHQILAMIDSDMIIDRIDLTAVGGARAVSALEWVGGEIKQSVLQPFNVPGGDLTCVLSSAEPVMGRASELASFVKVVTLLHRRTHAPWTDDQAPPEVSNWRTLPFYTAPETRPWFAEHDIGKRITALVTPQASMILFSETQTVRPVHRFASQPYAGKAFLIPLAGNSEEDIRRKLVQLREELLSSAELREIAIRAGARYQTDVDALYAMALVVRSVDQLRKETDLALDGLRKAFETGKPWNTPRGSSFTVQPQGKHGVAFVYPGAFNAYVGLGRELFLAFPMLNEWLSDFISNVGRSVVERSLFPRNRQPLTDSLLEEYGQQLMSNPVAMIEAGTTFSVIYTLLMQNLFRIRPKAAFGYSLGEISMLWSSGVWRSADAASDTWQASPLYRTRLCGPKEVVRDAWQIPHVQEAVWSTWLIKAGRKQVERLVAEESRVYVTIANLDNEIVIAGDTDGCQRIINKLDCHALRAPFDSVIHNPLARAEYETFIKLYTHPVVARPDCRFYSAATYKPLVLEEDALAHAIADMCCQPVDFPRLVNTVADSGPRIFIELGAQGTCSRWIKRILRGTPHAAVAINRPRVGDYESVLMVLAQLVTHRVPVELTPVFAPHWREPTPTSVARPQLQHAVTSVRPAIPEPVKVISEPEPMADPSLQPVTPTIGDDGRFQAFSQAILPLRRQVAQSQTHWLQQRASQLQHNTGLIKMQLTLAEQWLNGHPVTSEVMLDRKALQEFATGDITACLGDAYSVFEGRRLPRIPNGDLMLIDRVLHTTAVPGKFDEQPTLTAEVDVPEHTWYYQNSDVIPTAVLMEMALQPCGVLSAYMQTPMLDVHSDLYFRNLDGKATLLRRPDARGKTIQNEVQLLSTTRVKGIILQRYAFRLSCEGTPFYVGESSFGYFDQTALERQAGFTGVENAYPWLLGKQTTPTNIVLRKQSKLDFIADLKLLPEGGRYGQGYAFGQVPIEPDDWYFKCHFYQDPVMPGSLGVAAAQQALQIISGIKGKTQDATDVESVWRYRGQVSPKAKQIAVEVHVKAIDQADGVVHVTGDAGVYNNGTLIYDIRDLVIAGST